MKSQERWLLKSVNEALMGGYWTLRPAWHSAWVASTLLLAEAGQARPLPPLASCSQHMRPPPGLPTRWMPCAEVFTLYKPNHARQDNLWLPLSNENSNAFLHKARLGFRPQTLDPLLTPGCLWTTASVGVEEGHPLPTHLCLPCWTSLGRLSQGKMWVPCSGLTPVGPGSVMHSPRGHEPPL